MRELEEKFLKQTAIPLFEPYQEDFLKIIDKNKLLIKEKVLNTIEQIALKAQEKQTEKEDYAVAYIQFSMLQIGVLQGTYEVVVNAYDKEWHQGEPLWESFSLSFLFEHLETIKAKLYQDMKKYMGKIRPRIIDHFILGWLEAQMFSLVYQVNQLLKQWDEEKSFELMPKAEQLTITWGGYKNQFEVVYGYNSELRTEKDFKKLIEKEDEDSQGDESSSLVFSMWHSLKLHHLVIKEKPMTCSYLKEAYLENITFEESELMGINFKRAHFRNCHFIRCNLKSSDFREAVFDAVTFEKCNLESCLLQEAVYKEVDFTDALMQGAIITNEAVKLLSLSDHQLQELLIESRGKDAVL